jgi:hypothetical protein
LICIINSTKNSPRIDNFASVRIQKFSEKKFSEENEFYSINAVYPIDPYDRNSEISTWAESVLQKARMDWALGGDIHTSELRMAAEFPDRPVMNYTFDMNYKKYSSQKLNTVSYVIQNYEFTGGAHGNTDLQTFTFGQNGGIKLADILIVTPSNVQSITDIIRGKLVETLGDMVDRDMIHDGLDCAYTNGSSTQACDASAVAQNLQNFYITDDGITFIFGQYQVAAYVAGMTEVMLTWSELASFMNPGFELPLD